MGAVTSAVLPKTQPTVAQRPIGRSAMILGGLSVVLIAVAVIAVSIGADYIAPRTIIGMALQPLPIHPARTWSDTELTIVTLIRLPRVATGLMVGAALAAAGTVMQAVFRNGLADPGIIGTSAGASVGAVVAIASGIDLTFLGFGTVSLAAFVGALATTLLVYLLARVGGRVPSTTLLLAGFALSALLDAVVGVVETLSNNVQQVYIWLLGSLADTTGDQLTAAVPFLAVGLMALIALSGSLNILMLGDEQAQYLGLDATRMRLAVLILAALLTSIAVALAGVIAFVGLIVPHIARLLFGANHRLLLPAATLTGAIFLVVVDTIARMALQPTELPVGLVTALVGAPWFLVLLKRKRGEYAF